MSAVVSTDAAVPAELPVAGEGRGGLVLEGLAKRFGAVRAVDGVSLRIPAGMLVSFLGPSGCGKTTLLRLVAGLDAPDAGRVVLDGEDVTARPAHQREVGMVFQSLALFPHLDVNRNVGYSLKLRGTDKAVMRGRVAELLSLVDLDGLGERPVRKLSGGQRQRVAIARALARDPSLFLLDEPMSALDANLRESLQVELRLLQQRLGITTVMVTHDQREAMTMSDVVVLMNAGKVEQAGPPLEMFRAPRTAFAARFMGATNLLEGRVVGRDVVRVGIRDVHLEPGANDKVVGAEVVLSVRPGETDVVTEGLDEANTLLGEVVFVRDLGGTSECYVDCGLGGDPVVTSGGGRDHHHVRRGDRVGVRLPPGACVVVEP